MMRWREASFSDISLFIMRRLSQLRRSKANFASPSLGRGRALMPAPPFPTNLLLRKIFAGALLLPPPRRQHKCWTTRHLPEEEVAIWNFPKIPERQAFERWFYNSTIEEFYLKKYIQTNKIAVK